MLEVFISGFSAVIQKKTRLLANSRMLLQLCQFFAAGLNMSRSFVCSTES